MRECPLEAGQVAAVQRFDPPLSRAAGWAAAGLFVAAVVGLSLLLWNVHRLGAAELLAGGVALVGLLWLIGAITQPRSPVTQDTPMAAAR